MERPGLISIWFFIGVLLLAYGIIITITGIYELYVPPSNPVVMADLHSAVWWGAFMLVLGAVYSYKFRPR